MPDRLGRLPGGCRLQPAALAADEGGAPLAPIAAAIPCKQV